MLILTSYTVALGCLFRLKNGHKMAPFGFAISKNLQLLRGAHPPSDTPSVAQVQRLLGASRQQTL